MWLGIKSKAVLLLITCRGLFVETIFSKKDLDTFFCDPYYTEVVNKLTIKKSHFLCFNPFAFIFGSAWFFYKKMYLYGFVAIFFDLASLGFGLMLSNFLSITILIVLVLFLLSRVVQGVCANSFYYKHAKKVIEAAKKLNVHDDIYLKVLKVKGGSSLLSLFVMSAFNTVLNIFLTLVFK